MLACEHSSNQSASTNLPGRKNSHQHAYSMLGHFAAKVKITQSEPSKRKKSRLGFPPLPSATSTHIRDLDARKAMEQQWHYCKIRISDQPTPILVLLPYHATPSCHKREWWEKNPKLWDVRYYWRTTSTTARYGTKLSTENTSPAHTNCTCLR
eukprot:3066175-Rhodomonas_salina.2